MKLVAPKREYDLNVETIAKFGGLNQTDNYETYEFADMTNLSSERFPLIYPRASRALHLTLTSATALFSDGSKLCWVDGTNFVYDGVVKGTVTAGVKCMVEFNKYVLIFPDKKAYDTVNNLFASFTCPDITYATVHMNRVFGVKGQDVYACKLGDHTSWSDFSGENDDSWATDVAGFGNFTGITNYSNHVVMQSSETMHELYGYKPANFEIQQTVKKGGYAKSYAEVNSVLYFADRDGIYQFSGGMPRLISQKIDYSIDDAIAGTDKEKYFVCIKSGTSYNLLVYDPEYDIWHREDDLQVKEFAYLEGYLYALAADNKVYKFNSGTETISFSGTFNVAYDNDFFKDKTTKSVEVLAEVPSGGTLNIYLIGSGTETLIKTVSAATSTSFRIPINLRYPKYQLKFTGTGNVLIYAIKRISIGGGL